MNDLIFPQRSAGLTEQEAAPRYRGRAGSLFGRAKLRVICSVVSKHG
jgi:hypothetical protein